MADIIIAVVSSSALTTAVGAIFNMFKDKSGANKGLYLLLLDSMENKVEKYKEAGFITYAEKQRFYAIYNTYHNLGGNGYADSLKSDVDKLPVRDAHEIQ